MSHDATNPSHDPLDTHPRWMTHALRAAAAYNVVWGAWVVLFPNHLFDLVGMDRPTHPSIWQCVGMVVGVYGIGYWIASNAPFRHWPIVLVGFLGKLLGPLGYIDGVLFRGLDPLFGVTIPTNDLVWWVPFTLILWGALRANQGPELPEEKLTPERFRGVLDEMKTDADESLLDASRRGPVLVALLRHAGCTFCREAAADLAQRLPRLRERGLEPIVVTLSPPQRGRAFLDSFGLDGVPHVSDPGRRLYHAFDLKRGTFNQLFGPRVFLQALRAMRHGVGGSEGDGLLLPGTFVLKDGKVVAAQRHRTAGERIDFDGLCAVPLGDDQNQPAGAA